MKINREELKQYLLNNFDCYADTDEEVIPALTIGQAVDLFEQYVSERANTNETPNKHETEQLNILDVSGSATVEYFQTCPKCNGQGIISKPHHIAGDVHTWTSAESIVQCDVCEGKKIIPVHYR